LRQFLLASLAFAALGCAGQQPMTEIAIDPTMPPEMIVAVEAAAEQWFAARPDRRLPIRIGEDAGRGYFTLGECVGNAVTFAGVILEPVPTMLFCVGKVEGAGPEVLQQAAAHELGHAMALCRTHIGHGNLMARGMDNASPTLSDEDASYLEDCPGS
jgi:hypothetical protein